MDRRNFLRSSVAVAWQALQEQTSPAQASPAEHPIAPPVTAQALGASQQAFSWSTGGMAFLFELFGDRLRFRHVLPEAARAPAALPRPSELSDLEVSVLCTGEDVPDHHGAKFTGALPGSRLHFGGKEESAHVYGKQLVLEQSDPILGLKIQSIYEGFGELPVVRRRTRITNTSRQAVGLEYLSSAMLNNLADPATFQNDLRLHYAWNSWQAEANWRSVRVAEAGLVQNGNFSVSGVLLTSTGSWPCESVLPMAMVENLALGVTWFWQVEHNGSWHCQVAQTSTKSVYAYLGGPDAPHGQAWKSLAPGEVYESVPVAIGCVQGGFTEAIAALTRYRRASHRFLRGDMQRCPVIFNDAVTLGGDPTTGKELELISTASEIGCEVFCIDAGWSARPGENWWGAVGDWEPNTERFPGGFKQLTDAIRQKGMVPGLWVEPEVAGMTSRLARRPDSWFFVRHGRRILDHSRYHLDFRNPEVRAYTDAVFDRFIGEYGVGYIKLDYNINAREGTERDAESFGQGLLGHNRAFLRWMDALLTRHSDLTIETVASGSMRMEGSMLSRAQLQSISDGDDYRLYSCLTVGSSAVVLPEQMGVWSQPMEHDSLEAVSCNMVNAMLGRIHQSGFVARLSPQGKQQVKQGIAAYKESVRSALPVATPFYPLGMPDLTVPSQPSALGMRAPDRQMLAVWRRDGPPLVTLAGMAHGYRLLYPMDLGIEIRPTEKGLEVYLPKPQMGCVLLSTET